MKSKQIYLGLSLLLTTGAMWGVRTAWRAHYQLVTLDVREVPLPVVLRQIERQTWRKVRAEHGLDDVRVTLRVANTPLSEVLNRLGVQADARCSTLYAVYTSTRALQALNAALCGDAQVEAAGWTSLNPPQKLSLALPDGSQMTLPVLPAKELLLETALRARLELKPNPRASEAEAASMARQVEGKWTTYYEFTKARLGGGPGFAGYAQTSAKTNAAHNASGTSPNARFANLTPRQRVQQARQARGLPAK